MSLASPCKDRDSVASTSEALPGLSIDTMSVTAAKNSNSNTNSNRTLEKKESDSAVADGSSKAESAATGAAPARDKAGKLLSLSRPAAKSEDLDEIKGTDDSDRRSRCFSVDSTSSTTKIRYVSSFFIGLSFQKGMYYADVTPAVQVRGAMSEILFVVTVVAGA